MIRRLRRRITLLVISVLIIVSAGIVIGIYTVNNRSIISRVESALDALEENSGRRPSLPEPGDGNTPMDRPEGENSSEERKERTPPPRPAGETGIGEGAFDPDARFRPTSVRRRPPEQTMSREDVANLSNYYTMTLDEDGRITGWESDRADLYRQDTLQKFADQVLAGGDTGGRIGTQFYRLMTGGSERMLIVLDARLEMQAGQQVLVTTCLVAGSACILLSLGACLLIRRMIRPVEEAFRKQQQFVWDASHELKTPLAVIAANADLLEGDIGENEYLSYIRSEVRRTDSLVGNLLTLARMDRGTADRERTDMDFSEAVLSVLLPFESTVFEAGKTLESDVREGVRVTGSSAMLQQLTVILLSNALKYSDEGGIIRVKLERKNRGAELRVENTGEGIPPESLELIFDRFYRTDASRNSETGGEGLGLAIAKSIVETHHGKIHAESEPGAGASFIVWIPRTGTFRE